MNVLEIIEHNEAIRRIRIFMISGAICSMVFYFLMTRVHPQYADFLPGRIAISIFSLFSVVFTYIKKDNLLFWSRILIRIGTMSFLMLYLYLLSINGWSLFHCWSYFVVAAIICSTSMTWNGYVQYAIVGVGGPLILSLWAPLNWLELFHFHSANIATFAIIGVSAKSTFRYKNEVSKLTNDLILQSKMAALGEMAGGISHEINNPLAIIKGAVEQIKRVGPDSSEDKEKFNNLTDKISRMVERITVVTGGLKEFSQDTADQNLHLHDLNTIIAEGIKMCMRRFPNSNVEISFTPPEYPSLCLCKRNQIIEIVLNLCTNAVEATIEKEAPMVHISLTKNDTQYSLSISDNGDGVSEAISGKVMEPFVTTKDIGKGLGLGLSISHGFSRVNGGELSYYRDGQLTHFVLTLPIPESTLL